MQFMYKIASTFYGQLHLPFMFKTASTFMYKIVTIPFWLKTATTRTTLHLPCQTSLLFQIRFSLVLIFNIYPFGPISLLHSILSGYSLFSSLFAILPSLNPPISLHGPSTHSQCAPSFSFFLPSPLLHASLVLYLLLG